MIAGSGRGTLRGAMHGTLRAPATAWRWARRASVTVVILVVVVVALAASTGVLFFQWYSAHAADDARVAAMAAAKKKVPTLLSYSYTTFGKNLARAEANTTPKFRDTYGKLMTGKVEPTAKRTKVVTQATVSAASVISAKPGSATMLLFLSQQTKTSAKQQPVLNDNAVWVSMRQVNGTWLIDNLVPRG
ncbi:MAG: hypothetical protein J2P25_11135 [Nocardiopsaceae bacterium]|nr:hypothetical protein [Nocardiopsaceae bacterium]